MKGKTSRFGAFVGVLLCLAATLGNADAGTREYLYVDTDNGSDANDGSAVSPFQTLNKALREAYELRFAVSSPCSGQIGINDVDVLIYVTAATTPIAPLNHGGLEDAGWRTYFQECNSSDPPAFPIRMIERVHLYGVPVEGQKPRVLIDEFTNEYVSWGSIPVLERTFFRGASTATLANFHLDGTLYLHKNTDRLNALFAEDVTGLSISNCRIEDTYDGLRFHALDAETITTATVTDCEVFSQGPLKQWPPEPNNQAQGHAGAWLKGSGTLDVSFDGCWFQGCHDAIEVAGDEMTMGMLSISDCDFFRNENGVEAVGSGSLTTTITASRFDENYNFDIGMPHFWSQTAGEEAPFSPSAIAARNMTNTLTVRSTTFTNNSFGLIAGSEGTYDLGRNGLLTPGLNVFDFDFWLSPGPIRSASPCTSSRATRWSRPGAIPGGPTIRAPTRTGA